jgi:peptidyl-prolyl cis-trans isomerase A (cyclophilin A)
MQSAGVLISWPISPHVQSASTLHAPSSEAEPDDCGWSGGIGVTAADDEGGGVRTTVGVSPALWHAARAPERTRTMKVGRVMRARLYTRRMRARASLMPLLAVVACSRAAHVEPPPLDHRSNVPVVLETSEGVVRCELDGAHAPRALGMVVALATARAPFLDPRTHEVVRRRYYDGLPFFRAIPNVLLQTGCPIGDGSGTPGYRLPVEPGDDDAASLSRPGVLLLARYQPPPGRADPAPPAPGDTIGSQLVIALDDMSHLAGQVTVLGRCKDLDVVRRIATDVASGTPVRLLRLRL